MNSADTLCREIGRAESLNKVSAQEAWAKSVKSHPPSQITYLGPMN